MRWPTNHVALHTLCGRVRKSLTLYSLHRIENRPLVADGNTPSYALEPSRVDTEPNTLPSSLAENALARITRHARVLSGQMQALSATLFPPSSKKTLRSFSSGEVARFLGVSDGYLRQLSLDRLGPSPALSIGGRRSYTPTQIGELRTYLAGARPKEALSFLPTRRSGDKLQIVAVANFKGGSD